jgi:transposase
MSDGIAELARRLIIGHKRDGRSIYDAKAKHELILACREPGASMAKIARECGVNANQLASWVRQYELATAGSASAGGEVVDASTLAFVPVHVEAAAGSAEPALDLQARLPNGVVLDLRGCDMSQACRVIEALGRLRCSASTKG